MKCCFPPGPPLLGLSAFPLGWASAADDKKKPKILYFTKSAGFVHSVVDRKDKPLAFSEKILTELGEKNGFEVECSQDAAVFDGDLDKYDLLAFYTTGEPLNAAQKKKLLDAVAAGKPFVGIHAATDTFRGKEGDRSLHRHDRRRIHQPRRTAKGEDESRLAAIPRRERFGRRLRNARRMVRQQEFRQGHARHPAARDRRA